jgi:hypothetical protein
MAKIAGVNFGLYVGTGTTKTIIGGSKSVSFNSKYDTIDTTTRDGVGFVLGNDLYDLSVDGLVDYTVTGETNTKCLATMYKNKTQFNWYFGNDTAGTVPQTLCTTCTYMSGCGKFTDLKLSSSYNGAVEYSASIKGIGSWSQT